MLKKYDFKRGFFYAVLDSIKENSVTFLLGPRKCGKTVCLKQINDELKNSEYVDVKAYFKNEEQKLDFIDKVIDDIRNNRDVVHLIDESTYLNTPDKDIAIIASAFTDVCNTNTKIVFAGSQSYALKYWGHIAFAGNASFIEADFLSYPEWLKYKGIDKPSEETYLDFVINVSVFYSSFTSTLDYLKGCLDETVISNSKSIEYVIGNDYGDINVDMLLDVLYSSLITLHNHTLYQKFIDPTLFARNLRRLFRKELSQIPTNIQDLRIDEILSKRYNNFRNMDALDCKMAIKFLYNCGLITLTYISDGSDYDPYIADKFLKDFNELYKKPDIFKRFNITINYPMFYIDLIKHVIMSKLDSIPNELLGSIVECHVRGLLPNTGFEFSSANNVEIDYVLPSIKAIEITISAKSLANVNFDVLLPSNVDNDFSDSFKNILSNNYKKILLTKSLNDTVSGINRIPYYQFIFDNSYEKNYFYRIDIVSEEDVSDDIDDIDEDNKTNDNLAGFTDLFS